MPKDLKVGERVRLYDGQAANRGTVVQVYPESGLFRMKYSDGDLSALWSVKQCRRIKPREKSVRVTRKMLAAIWYDSIPLSTVAKALGLE